MKSIFYLLIAFIIISCESPNEVNQTSSAEGQKKIAVLLVNHGSVAESWRNQLLAIETQVRDSILANPKVGAIRTAFMEYTEPSIATRLKEFDQEGFDEVVVVPIFLTVSSHYSHDIPVICGLSADAKIKAQLDKEKIEVYKGDLRITITPPLDYTAILKKNIARRVKALSTDSENEGVLLVAYGDAQYNQQWEEMVSNIGKYLQVKTGHEDIAYAWCGHLVGYSTGPTKSGIAQLRELNDNVIVIPILIANDPYFQDKIIQTAVNEMNENNNVKYVQDAILPDVPLNNWVVKISTETVNNL